MSSGYMESQMQNFIESGISEADRCYTRIAELEDQNAALSAQVEALKSAYKKLSGAINDMDDAEIDTEEMDRLTLKVFKVMKEGYQIANEPEQNHLRQARADAGRDGFVEGIRLRSKGPCNDWQAAANQYHASILDGKD